MLEKITIKSWLADASQELKQVGINSHKLDAEIILAFVLNKNRTFLVAHSDMEIADDNLTTANNLLNKRLEHQPIAYLTNQKEFYGRNFVVTPDVLIPRPESEDIITILKDILPPATSYLPPTTLIDIGTGSGILGIAAKLEFSFLNVTLTDISEKALIVARSNADKLEANVEILQSDLLNNFNEKVDIIIANLPYVDKSWERSIETDFEPSLALFADNNGLKLIHELINQTPEKINNNGYLIIEADPVQHQDIIEYAEKYNFNLIKKLNYITCFRYQR